MPFPIDGIPRPGMEVPGMPCPKCGGIGVYWIAGEDINLIWQRKPKPHFHCWTCHHVFAAPYPKQSRQAKAQIKKSNLVNLWRNC
jgi:hypothetical protein